MTRHTVVSVNFIGRDAASFEESKHPRAGNGEFGSKGSGSSGKNRAQKVAEAHKKAAEAHRAAAEAHASGGGDAQSLSGAARKHSEGVEGGDNAHQFSARNAHHNSESGDTEGAVTHHRQAAKEHERAAKEAESEGEKESGKHNLRTALHSALKGLTLARTAKHAANVIEEIGQHSARI